MASRHTRGARSPYTAPVPPLPITPTLCLPEDELAWSFVRASGPGGQNVNKVATQVELRWSVTRSRALRPSDREWLLRRLAAQLTLEGELIVTSSLTRSQARNRQDAGEKLATLVREALVRPKRRRATRPGRGAVERRLTEKKKQGERKRQRQSHE